MRQRFLALAQAPTTAGIIEREMARCKAWAVAGFSGTMSVVGAAKRYHSVRGRVLDGCLIFARRQGAKKPQLLS